MIPTPLMEWLVVPILMGCVFASYRCFTRKPMAHNFGKFDLKLGVRRCVDEEGKPVDVTIMARLKGTGAVVDGGAGDCDEDGTADVVCRVERKEAT